MWLKKMCREQSLSTALLHRLSTQSIAIFSRSEKGFEYWEKMLSMAVLFSINTEYSINFVFMQFVKSNRAGLL